MRSRRRLAALCAGVVAGAVGGCGGSSSSVASGSVSQPPSTSTPSPTPSPSPTPKPELLFAVLEAHGSGTGFPLLDDTVAIVGLDGVARAKATFTPRSRPVIGNAAPVLVPEAHVAAGAVFYVDGRGTVHRLAVGSQPTTVATFTIVSSQSEFSFAVSPDGQRLVGSAFTFPPPGSACSDPFCNPFKPGAPYTIDFQSADSSGAVSTIRHEERAQSNSALDHVPMVAGWLDSGPVMTTDQATGTQGAVGDRIWFGDLHTMDSTGHPGSILGGAGCNAWAALRDGTVACNNPQSARQVSVRGTDGTPRWSASTTGYVDYLALSADGNGLALHSDSSNGSVLESVGGKASSLPTNFLPQGYLDVKTLIGITSGAQQGDMAIVRLDQGKLLSLGFTGSFVGVVQG